MFRSGSYTIRFRASWNHSRSSHHISFIYTLISGYIPTNEKDFQKFFPSRFPNNILYTFCLSMCASTRLVDSILLNSIAYFRYCHIQFSGSHSGVVEDPSRLGCHTGRLRVTVPWRRRNCVLSKHRVTHIQRHNLTSQDTWTQTYTSLPIFTDSGLLGLLMICTTLTSS